MSFPFAPDGALIDEPMKSVMFIDGATTPLTKGLDFIQGSFTAEGLHRILNAKVQIQGAGKHQAVVNGERVYPTITLTGKVDKFTSGSTASGTVSDFWHSQTGTLFAAAVNALPADAPTPSREPHRHVVVEYEKNSTTTVYLAFEGCYMDSRSFSDESAGQFEMSLVCTGRVFADGVLLCAQVGATTTPPAWLPS
jgi:hypothetical protein